MVYFSASAPGKTPYNLAGSRRTARTDSRSTNVSSSRHLGEQVPRRCAGAHWMASWTVPAVGPTRVGKEEEHTPVSAQENKVLVRRLFEAFGEGNLNAIEEMLAPDFVDHSPLPDQGPGREGYKLLLAEDRAALSDVRTTIEYQATDGDDMVISRLTMRSTHDRGKLMGLTPTGQERESTGIIHRVSGSKIAEEWSESSGLATLMERRLDRRSVRARARRAVVTGGKAHSAGFTSQGGARTRGLATLPPTTSLLGR